MFEVDCSTCCPSVFPCVYPVKSPCVYPVQEPKSAGTCVPTANVDVQCVVAYFFKQKGQNCPLTKVQYILCHR